MGNVFDRAFGHQVRDLRRARAWTQDGLAVRMTKAGFPMHQTTVAKLEGGTRPTNVGEIATIAAIFDVPIGTLFERSGHMEVRIYLQGLKSTIELIEREQDQLRERLAELDKEHKEAEATYQKYQDLSQRLTEPQVAATIRRQLS